MSLVVAHTLGAAGAAQRLRDVAAAEQLELECDADGLSGRVAKALPLGPVSARWVARESEVEVTVLEKPAFLPEGLVLRALEDGLRKVLDPPS